jgi:hypothetical protein
MGNEKKLPMDVRELVAGRLYSTAVVASVCGVNVNTVLRWVVAGKLSPALKGQGKQGEYRFFGHSVLSMLLVPVRELPPLEETAVERRKRGEKVMAEMREREARLHAEYLARKKAEREAEATRLQKSQAEWEKRKAGQ